MKQLFAAAVSAALVSALLIPSYSEVCAVELYTVSRNGYTMNFTVDAGGEAYLISCSGSGSELIIPDEIDQSYPVVHIGSGAFSGLTEILKLYSKKSMESK